MSKTWSQKNLTISLAPVTTTLHLNEKFNADTKVKQRCNIPETFHLMSVTQVTKRNSLIHWRETACYKFVALDEPSKMNPT